MIEAVWYLFIAGACLVSIANWRAGLYLAVMADCLRDPVRKLTAEEPILITLTGAALWLVMLIVAISREWDEVRRLGDRYPRVRTSFQCLLIAIVPAAALSCLLYTRGWMLAAVGVVSYVVPFIGIAVGYLWAQSEREIYRLFSFYSILNSLVLIGVPLEYWHFNVDGLGGLKDAEWVRYHDGYAVDLIAGFYRSPDIMGLHAAHVIMFSVLLAVRSKTASQFGWMGLALWGAFCVLFCGRRKMVGIPLVFIASYLAVGMVRGTRHVNRLLGGAAVCILLGVAVGLTFLDRDEYVEYTDYAGTIFTQGPGRANELIVGSSIGTLQQVGVLGAGLGTATQGRYYVNVQTSRERRGWQEDGVSRMLMEFGVPGAILIFVAGLTLLMAIYQSLGLVDPDSSVQTLQIGLLSIVLANAASFIISHQQYSGDPVSALFATMLAGAALGAPRIFARSQRSLALQTSHTVHSPADSERQPVPLVAAKSALPQ